ncbi:MAG TPA: DUF4395 domain-containing protein [Cellulomonas sp.]
MSATPSGPSVSPAPPSNAPSERVVPPGIDPRGPRVGAGITAVLLVVVLLLPDAAATVALLVIALLFAVGTARGAQGSVQGQLYRRLVRPRLAPPTELEDPRPPRFAQGVGLVITGAGAVLGLLGVSGAVPVAAVLALVAAVLNSAFGLCLGCELYLLGARLRARPAA